jgi:hypothetical protein
MFHAKQIQQIQESGPMKVHNEQVTCTMNVMAEVITMLWFLPVILFFAIPMALLVCWLAIKALPGVLQDLPKFWTSKLSRRGFHPSSPRLLRA